MTFNLHIDQRGFTVTEVMIAAALASLIALGIVQVLNSVNLSLRDTTETSSILKLRTGLIRELGKKTSWEATYNHAANNSFDCLVQNISNCPNTSVNDVDGNPGGTIVDGHAEGTVFKLVAVRADGTKEFFLNRTTTNGFNYKGEGCTTAVADITDAKCPIRIKLYWTLVSQGTGSYIGGYAASGYYPQSYFTQVGITITDTYGFVATTSARIKVTGDFAVYGDGAGYSSSIYDFEIQKDVP